MRYATYAIDQCCMIVCSGSLINVLSICQSIMRIMHTLNTSAISVKCRTYTLISLWCMRFMLDVWKENIKRLNDIDQCISLYAIDLCMLWMHDAYCTYDQLLMYATCVIDLRFMLSINDAAYKWYRVLDNNTRYVWYW